MTCRTNTDALREDIEKKAQFAKLFYCGEPNTDADRNDRELKNRGVRYG
jgi:hypothetical protein